MGVEIKEENKSDIHDTMFMDDEEVEGENNRFSVYSFI